MNIAFYGDNIFFSKLKAKLSKHFVLIDLKAFNYNLKAKAIICFIKNFNDAIIVENIAKKHNLLVFALIDKKLKLKDLKQFNFFLMQKNTLIGRKIFVFSLLAFLINF